MFSLLEWNKPTGASADRLLRPINPLELPPLPPSPLIPSSRAPPHRHPERSTFVILSGGGAALPVILSSLSSELCRSGGTPVAAPGGRTAVRSDEARQPRREQVL